MLLYDHPLSGNTHKVRLLLGYLGRPTIADCACAPDAALSSEGGVPAADYAAVSAWLHRAKAWPGFTPMPGFA